jgi:hypothetical protein
VNEVKMTTLKLISAVGISFFLMCACAGATEPTFSERAALKEPAYDDISLSMAKTLPPQFDLMLERRMPSPGWKLEVNSVKIDETERRIVVRATEHRPGGMVATVITPTKMRVSLGKLTPGSYFVEIWVRRSDKGTYRPTAALVLGTH